MPPVIEGTWEEIKAHEAELAGHRFRLTPIAEAIANGADVPLSNKRKDPASLMGKYPELSSTEEFMRRKHEETEREDRKFR